MLCARPRSGARNDDRAIDTAIDTARLMGSEPALGHRAS
jgi:hypothetical protein